MPDEENRLLLHAVPEPPIAHAYHHWDEPSRTLTYTYNNRRIVQIQVPETARVSFRHGSDGQLQSFPLHQQVYVMLSGEPVTATVRFELSPDAVNMRPRRAASEQAIIGQVGRPLLPAVSGLYDIDQDLMISWFGHPWQWLDEHLVPDANGNLTAAMTVELGPKTWIINIKPHYYRTHLGYHYHQPWQRRPKLEPIVGWCTWEAHRRDLSEEKIVAAADFFAKHLKAYGFEYIQIDDGFEKLPLPVIPHGTLAEAWLETRDEFPEGHAGVVRKIKQRGLQSGIWTSAAIYSDEFADAQPDCLLKDRAGRPLLGDWVKYVLDCTPQSLDRHVRPYFAGLKAAGYTYFKIDAIRHLHYDGLHEAVLLGLMENEEAERRFRAFLRCGRDALGDDVFWLSSWGVLTQMVGLCDGCRTSQDAMPTWAGMQMQLVESARWFFTQRILFLNDPDHVCVRAPLEWARTVLSMVALTGGLFMLSDALAEYDEQRLRLVQRCIPPLTTVTAETGPLDSDYAAYTWTKFHGFHVLDEKPFDAESMTDEEARNQAGQWPTMDDDHPFSTLWAIHLDGAIGRWCVVGRFASIALRSSKLPIESLGLDPRPEYLVFDFWKQKYVGCVRGAIDCPALGLGHCQILAVRPALDRPQLLSSTRHVSQDAVSVRAQAWRDGKLTLALEGVSDTTETYWIHVPAGFELPAIKTDRLDATAGKAEADAAGGQALAIDVTFPPTAGQRSQGTLAISFHTD
jgi:alpha-galactosidase